MIPREEAGASYVLDGEGRFVRVSESADALLSAGPDDLIGERIGERFPDLAEVEEIREALEAGMAGEPASYRTFDPSVDAWVDAEVQPREDGGVRVSLRGLSRSGEPEQEQVGLDEGFEKVAENVGQIVWMSSDDPENIFYVNPAFEDVWGSTLQELRKEPSRFLEAIHPEDREAVAEAYMAMPEASFDEEFRILQPDDGVRWIHAEAVPVRGDDGEIARLVGIAEDVTEHVSFEEMLTSLHASSRRLLSARERREALELVAGAAREVIELPAVAVFLHDEERDTLATETALAEAGTAIEEGSETSIDLSTPLGRAFREGQPRLISGGLEAALRTDGDGDRSEDRSTTLLPMGDHGVLAVTSRSSDGLDRRRSRLVEILATNAEAALDRLERERLHRQEEERFRSLVREVEEYAIFVLDPGGRVQTWNSGARRIKGYSEEEILGRHFSIFYTQEEREQGIPQRNLEAAREHGSTQDEGWRVRADGSRFWANVTITALRDDEGNLEGFAKVTRDMSDRRERKRQLQREKKRFRSLVREVEEYAIFMMDPEGKIQTWNSGARRIKGYSEEEILGRHFSIFYTQEEREQGIPQRNLEAAREHGSTQDEGWRVRADGSRFWANVTITALRDDDGTLRGFSKVTRDMTERRRWERELEESRRTMVDNFPNGAVTLVDEQLRYRLVGGQPPKGIEVSVEEMRDRPVAEVLPSELADTLVPRYEDALEGQPSTFEQEFRGQTYRFHIVPVRDDDGQLYGAMGMSQDVTDQKERERRLKESNERLEQFAYAASHDLQEPLRMVTNYLQLIEERYGEHLDSEGEEFFEYAIDGAYRMREMIHSLLEYARVTTQGRALKPTDAGAVVEDVLTDLRPQIEETDAEIEVGHLPTVKADPDQLAQVLRNLVSNALKYTEEEPPRVSIDAERVGRRWRFSVRDEGVGIEPEYTDKVFEVFRRLEGREEHEGTGVGLAVCQQIVARHEGRMWVDSEPGEGSTFYFTMPPAEPEMEPPPRASGETHWPA